MSRRPNPPETFDDDQRELWHRVFDQPQVEPTRDADLVTLTIVHAEGIGYADRFRYDTAEPRGLTVVP